MNSKVSVIISTYKRSDTIERAIKSVLNQTYHNIELIVVDDNIINSREHLKTEEIVKKYKEVKYIKNRTNLGGGGTRNVGIKESQGEYIAFLDDDDEFLPTKIEKQLNLYLSDPSLGLIYCYMDNVDGKGNHLSFYKRDYEGFAIYGHMLDFIATTSTYLIRKDVLIDVNMFDNVSSQQDARLVLKILGKGYAIKRINEPLIKLYIHDGERITKVSDKYINDVNDYYNECKKYYNRLNYNQRQNIDFKFYNQICNLYIQNNNYKKALLYIWKLICTDIFNFRWIYNLFKIVKKLF